MPDKAPVKISPSFHEKVWGTTQLEPWFPNPSKPIGEVWFQTEPPLSLLIKFLFTSDKLSVQVHPDDAQAQARGLDNGKTEMWYILRADEGAGITLGLKRSSTAEEMKAAAESGTIEELLNFIEVEPGDTFFTPANVIHALGGGLALCEIQQNSDTTYRLYDYGRPRELHLDDGLAVSRLEPDGQVEKRATDVPNQTRTELIGCKYFRTELLRGAEPLTLEAVTAPYQVVIVLEGSGTLGSEAYQAGECWLLENGTSALTLTPETPSRFLLTGPPA